MCTRACRYSKGPPVLSSLTILSSIHVCSSYYLLPDCYYKLFVLYSPKLVERAKDIAQSLDVDAAKLLVEEM